MRVRRGAPTCRAARGAQRAKHVGVGWRDLQKEGAFVSGLVGRKLVAPRTMSDRDAEPLLESGLGPEAEGLHTWEDDAAYVNPPRRYLYAPISYEQAMAPPRPPWHPAYWYRLIREHWHVVDALRPSDDVKAVFLHAGSVLSRCWPQNRIHQIVLTMIGLWVLVSYASWSVASVLPQSSYESMYYDYSDRLMHDLRGFVPYIRLADGVIEQNGTWHGPHCYAIKPLRYDDAVRCMALTNFTLKAMPLPNSLESTDTTFVYVNPEVNFEPEWEARDVGLAARDDDAEDEPTPTTIAEPDSKRKAPAYVYLLTAPSRGPDDPLSNLLHVEIVARFDHKSLELLTHSLVSKVRRSQSEGVEIVTPPTPDYGFFWEADHEPLFFDIFVHVPEGQQVAGFTADLHSGNVEAFTPHARTHYHAVAHEFNTRRKSGAWAFFGLMPSETRPQPLNQTEEARLNSVEHFFGRFVLHLRQGNIALGARMSSTSSIVAKTVSGIIESTAWLSAKLVHMIAESGSISLYEAAGIHAWEDARLRVRSGGILLGDSAQVQGSKTSASVEAGSIGGTGTWHANLSLALRSEGGGVNANMAVLKPSLEGVPYDDYLRTDEGRRVSTSVQATAGDVRVRYVSHVPGVPLHAMASADHGSVDVTHAAEFEGTLRVQGLSAALDAPPFPDGRHLVNHEELTDNDVKVVTARTYYDEKARGPPPVLPSKYPVHLESGKTPLNYGAESVAQAEHGNATLHL